MGRSGDLPAIQVGGRGQWQVERSKLEDSAAALDFLERSRTDKALIGEDTDSVHDECHCILGSALGIDIRFEWVPRHKGHPLNEIADLPAVLARRNREMDVDDITPPSAKAA